MGYAVAAQTVLRKTKEALISVSSPYIIPYYENNDTTPYKLWVCTVDLTNVDKFILSGQLKSEGGGSTAYCRLYMDSTIKATLDDTSATFNWSAIEWDCSGETGEHELSIRISTANAANKAFIQDIVLLPQSS